MRNDGTSLPVANIRDTLNDFKKTVRAGRKNADWYDLDETPSTMDISAGLAKEGCGLWTIVSARKQLNGRGTHGRSWESPGGKGLWISIVLPPPEKPEYLDNLSVLTAQALIRCFSEYTDLNFEIKHPNDVIIGGRKIAGILFESVISGMNVVSVVLGMGVNLCQTAGDFEKCGLFEATSLFMETGTEVERGRFLKSFVRHFKPMYERSVLRFGIETGE
jgi:BirA family transcriptional regulator, biotin operon repressor / biotin---[acetyl-CoA-carboxylase] ligase